MDYVYGVLFTDGTAKFGRSTDLWKRLYAYDSEGKRQGNSLTSILFCPVIDGVKSERKLLVSASEMLEQKGRESFDAGSLEKVADVFDDCGVPYVACKMRGVPFGPELSIESFSPDLAKFNHVDMKSSSASRKDRIKIRILKAIDNYSGPVTESIIKNRLLNYPIQESMRVVEDMIEEGVIKEKHSDNGRVTQYVRV